MQPLDDGRWGFHRDEEAVPLQRLKICDPGFLERWNRREDRTSRAGGHRQRAHPAGLQGHLHKRWHEECDVYVSAEERSLRRRCATIRDMGHVVISSRLEHFHREMACRTVSPAAE